MNYVYLTLNWVFGVLFGMMGLFSLFESPMSGFCLIAIAVLLLPPARNVIYTKTKVELSVKARTISIVVLFILFGIFSGQSQGKKSTEASAKKAQEQAESAAKVQQENLEYFKNNRDKVISSVSKAISEKNYQSAISISNKYLSATDGELKSMHAQAKAALDERTRAEKEAKEKAQLIKKQQEERRLAASLQKMTKKADKIERVDWYRDKSSPVYTNQNGFFLYIGKNSTGGAPWLRFRIQYNAEDWLFIESFVVMADGQRFERVGLNFERDNDSEIWEWYDDTPTGADLQMIRAIIASKEAVIRFNGRQYRKDKTITSSQKIALQNVLDAYKALGGS